LHYFCGDAASPTALIETEPLRITFYKATAAFARAYSTVAQSLVDADYSDQETEALRREVEFYTDIRGAIKKHSGEELDIKPYEADMRHLINTYIQADPATELGELGDMSLTELIVETGIHDAIARKLNAKGKLSRNAIAEGIINNVRKTIIRDQLTDPRFYDQMSKLLEDLIAQNRADTVAYEQFLRSAEALVQRLASRQPQDGVPAMLHGNREATVIYNNLDALPATNFRYPTPEEERAKLAVRLDRLVRENAPAGFRGDQTREAQLLNALYPMMDRDREATRALFEIIKNQPGY
jgi:type I restriction enzyme R subunit